MISITIHDLGSNMEHQVRLAAVPHAGEYVVAYVKKFKVEGVVYHHNSDVVVLATQVRQIPAPFAGKKPAKRRKRTKA